MGEERNFYSTRDGAYKFWRVLIDGQTQTVCWGRIGTTGQTLTRDFSGSDEAQKATNALIAQKTAKGYVEASREEMDALAPAPAARREKAPLCAEFQLLLPFGELAPSAATAPVATNATRNAEPSLSLFD